MNKKSKMRVLRVINSLEIGGAERSITTNVPIHIKNGFDMDVLLLNGKKTFFYNDLSKNGVKIYSIGKNSNIYNPFLIIKIIKYLKKYDIVHVHLFPALYWVAMAKLICFSKVKLVFTEHNTTNRRINVIFLRLIDNFIYRIYDHIIAISDAAKKNLIKHLFGYDEITTIYNCVDIENLLIESNRKVTFNEFLDKTKIYLIQIAGFREQKDQDTLIKAIYRLPEKYVAVFVGDGERLEKCKQLTKTLSVEHRVFFLGKQNNIGALIKESNIMVMSSHWEGFGRAAVEGMALSKPVIASNVPGLSEVVKDAGLLFNAGDDKELAKLVLSLMNNPDYYKLIASKCFERSKKYDISKMIKGYEQVYNKLYN